MSRKVDGADKTESYGYDAGMIMDFLRQLRWEVHEGICRLNGVAVDGEVEHILDELISRWDTVELLPGIACEFPEEVDSDTAAALGREWDGIALQDYRRILAALKWLWPVFEAALKTAALTRKGRGIVRLPGLACNVQVVLEQGIPNLLRQAQFPESDVDSFEELQN